MLIKRQLPKFYARGSIFNVTAANLSDKEQQHVSEVSEMMVKELYEDRAQFRWKLNRTIGADYKDMGDNGPADNEFRFAIWKASLHLLYDCSYTFICKNCEAKTYLTAGGRVHKIDRQHTFCPECKHCEVDDPKDSGMKAGDFIDESCLLLLIDQLADEGKEAPSYRSCIRPIIGNKKTVDPDIILNDPEQRKKFFSEFVWNYLKQVIKENAIQKQFCTTTISGCSDMVAIERIVAFLNKSEVKYDYDRRQTPTKGCHIILCDLYGIAPRLLPELAEVFHEVRSWGVEVTFDNTSVKVKLQHTDYKMVEAEIKTREYVIIETSIVSKGEIYQDKIESLECPMNGLAEYEIGESMQVVRSALSDNAQVIFDVITQTGEHYPEFMAKFGERKARKIDMAEFLDITVKKVNELISEIAVQWQVHVPAGEINLQL